MRGQRTNVRSEVRVRVRDSDRHRDLAEAIHAREFDAFVCHHISLGRPETSTVGDLTDAVARCTGIAPAQCRLVHVHDTKRRASLIPRGAPSVLLRDHFVRRGDVVVVEESNVTGR